MSVVINGSVGVNTPGVTTKAINYGVVGDRRGMYASQDVASPTIQLSCTSHILGNANGDMVMASLNNVTFNTGITGAGGMTASSGVAPTSGWIAVYHIYSPNSDTNSLIAATLPYSIAAPEILAAADLPPGYTYSALAAILPTDGSKYIPPLVLRERKVSSNFFPSSAMIAVDGEQSGFMADISNKVPLNVLTIDVTLLSTSVSGTVPASGAMMELRLNSIDTSITGVKGELVNRGLITTFSNSVGPTSSGNIIVTKSRKMRVLATQLPPGGFTSRSTVFFLGLTF